MKGLLVKDLCYLKNQRSFIVGIFLISLLLGMTQKGNSVFVIAYCVFIGAMLALGTCTTDEQNSGFAFLFSLPISRKTYALEKILLLVLICILSAILGIGVQIVVGLVRHSLDFGMYFACAGIILWIYALFFSFLLPAQLKYGAERSRIITFLAIGLFFAFIAVAATLMSIETTSLLNLVNRFVALPVPVIVGIGAFTSFCVLALSYRVSVRLLMKKDL